ncbi:uncharacterized protein ALTATR162_LOCUS12119 [Alternaria atra]|uniref:Uncharacterized protein n=1 Tax=Alternaria atra TaxID=119953 RepID=A0A8J2IEE7_9PLEO|nr:uncharacterized protein ALTATR162_LOCUS12119 [Alternaria atra]CAG5190059.1 unnamed protein product [Alternaria atra]
MARNSKRKNVPPASSESSKPAKRQRKPSQIFEQGINPAPPTPPSTVRRLNRSRVPTPQRNHDIPSPVFEPEAPSQLTTDTADILGEDEDEEVFDTTADDEDRPVEFALRAATAEEDEGVSERAAGGAGDSPGVAVAASAAQSSQRQRLESQNEEVDEEPHLHFRYRAFWGSVEKNAIASASDSRRNKPMYTVSEDKVWRWADSVIESQKPRPQAKADRCTIALQRSRRVAGEGFTVGNWLDFEDEVVEMNKESAQLMTCDFDLVLRDELPALQPASQLARSGGVARSRPGIVTAIQEDGLAAVVTAERCASGVAIGIKDYWRCNEEGCSNNTNTCWRRPLPGRQIDRPEEHYKVNGNTIATWATAVAREECTIQEPSDEIHLSLMMAKDRSESEKRRRRRKVSPTSSNSSIEGLTKAILAGHLAQMRAPQQCQHQSAEYGEYSKYKKWDDITCPQVELHQHTYNFFKYWCYAMPQLQADITKVKREVFEKGHYDINMLMDRQTGMTLEAWVEYFNQPPSMLSHLRRKAHDWRMDYGGLTQRNLDAIQKLYRNAEADETPEREVLGEVSGN